MILAVDADRFGQAGFAYTENGGAGVFSLVVDGETSPHVLVRVPLNADGQLVFFPSRSAAQRQVLDALGEPYTVIS